MYGLLRAFLVLAFVLLAAVIAPVTEASASDQKPIPGTRACDRDVCEQVLRIPPPVLEVDATATPPGARCGHFRMTLTELGRTVVQNGTTMCSARPSTVFNVSTIGIRTPTTVAMQFISVPPTPGDPVLCL